MITLYNVVDIRTGREYSIVKVSESKAKFFIPINSGEEDTEE